MLIKIRAYRDNDLEHGESIRLSFQSRNCIYSASDIDELISKLTEARDYASNASVDDEPLEIQFEL